MWKIDFKSYAQSVFELIFPTKGGFDFSKTKPEKLCADLPRCADLRGATALAGKRVRVALSYRHRIVRALVWQIKFKKDAHALGCGGYILYRSLLERTQIELKDAGIQRKILIIPMPVSPARRRERGYNQCELLARAMIAYGEKSTESTKSSGMVFEVRTDILFRTKNVKKQTFKNRRERMENMRGVFEVRDIPIPEKDLFLLKAIVLDDVITTGSTLLEAIDCLEQAGFADVHGLGLAH